MNFREAFQNYKSETATPEETAYIELEKVTKSIRRRSRNLILISVTIFTILVLLANYALFPLLDRLYYNPMAREYDEFSYDIDFSLVAYTELHQGGYYYANTFIENTGIGTYAMTLIRYNLSKNEQEYITAYLNKDRLTIPFSFLSGNLSLNIFARGSSPVYDLDPDIKERFTGRLKELPDYVGVTAAVSFPKDLTMDQLIALMESNDLDFLWAGIRNAPEDKQRYPLCGMDLSGSGYIYEKINDQYPSFELSEVHESGKKTASDYEAHFKSLLQFSLDHPDFLNALDENKDYVSYYRSILDYVKENGVKTYGVLVKGSASDILALADRSGATQVWPLDANIGF